MTQELSESIVHYAQQHLGFNRAAIMTATPSSTFPQFVDWLNHHYHADMDWLETNGRKDKRSDVRTIMPSAQSVITLAYTYRTDDLPAEVLNDPARGIFARYTWGKDYHRVLKKKLLLLLNHLEQQLGETVQARAYVDTGPVLERELAARAGIGFVGHNSMIINPQFGSYIFLAEIIVDQPLTALNYKHQGGCRACRKCIATCPTKAILQNRTIDARRCISYLTIESQGSIPEPLRPLLKNRIYGCDICQEVCPWNNTIQARATTNDWLEASLDRQAPYLTELAQLTETTFIQRYQGTPIMRAKRTGLLRNVAVALGNWGHPAAEPALQQLAQDPSDLIRDHAAWGLRQLLHQP